MDGPTPLTASAFYGKAKRLRDHAAESGYLLPLRKRHIARVADLLDEIGFRIEGREGWRGGLDLLPALDIRYSFEGSLSLCLVERLALTALRKTEWETNTDLRSFYSGSHLEKVCNGQET